MLGKDYMLAIILVNCDGVHRGSRWEDPKLEGKQGSEGRLPRGSKTGWEYVSV
jgi:hypothetical protein